MENSPYIRLSKWIKIHIENIGAEMLPGWEELGRHKPDKYHDVVEFQGMYDV